jgi:hypothetical protein
MLENLYNQILPGFYVNMISPILQNVVIICIEDGSGVNSFKGMLVFPDKSGIRGSIIPYSKFIHSGQIEFGMELYKCGIYSIPQMTKHLTQIMKRLNQ